MIIRRLIYHQHRVISGWIPENHKDQTQKSIVLEEKVLKIEQGKQKLRKTLPTMSFKKLKKNRNQIYD